MWSADESHNFINDSLRPSSSIRVSDLEPALGKYPIRVFLLGQKFATLSGSVNLCQNCQLDILIVILCAGASTRGKAEAESEPEKCAVLIQSLHTIIHKLY
jgi:hypothetical protein